MTEGNTREEDEIAISHITAEDISHPLEWVERLAPRHLELWLRRALLSGNTLPFHVPRASSLAVVFSKELRRGSPRFIENLRNAVTSLIEGWEPQAPTHYQDDLLILCARFKCVAAVPAVTQIAARLLVGHPREVWLRQRSLSVLSGLKASGPEVVEVYEQYFNDFNYTSLCYRALYRLNLSYAVRKLPALLEIYQKEQAYDELKDVLRLLFLEYLQTSAQRVNAVWMQLIQETEPAKLKSTFRILQRADIYLVPFSGLHDSEAQGLEIEYQGVGAGPVVDRINIDGLSPETVQIISRIVASSVPSYYTAGVG